MVLRFILMVFVTVIILNRFPCAETTELLIRCGANVNAMDNDGNTPLHLIVNYHKAISDFRTLCSIINVLTENGAHMDCVNKRGETALEACATGSKCSFSFSHKLGYIEERTKVQVAFCGYIYV